MPVILLSQSDKFPNHQQILQLETVVLSCKCLQSLQNNNRGPITLVLGRNISLPNTIPLVLHFEPEVSGVLLLTVIIQRTLNDWIDYSI